MKKVIIFLLMAVFTLFNTETVKSIEVKPTQQKIIVQQKLNNNQPIENAQNQPTKDKGYKLAKLSLSFATSAMFSYLVALILAKGESTTTATILYILSGLYSTISLFMSSAAFMHLDNSQESAKIMSQWAMGISVAMFIVMFFGLYLSQ